MIFEAEVITRENFGVEHGTQSRDALLFVLEGSFSCALSDWQGVVETDGVFAFCRDVMFDRKVLRPLRCIYVRFDHFPIPLSSGPLGISDLPRLRSTLSYLAAAVERGDDELTEHLLRDVLLLTQRQQAATDRTVADCINYFSLHYGQQISLDRLSRQFSVSKQGLIQKFRRHTGMTPMKYLSGIRMTQSKQLLRNTTLPVSEIAERCGFDNVYYFSNTFKRATGVSPSHYRTSSVL